MSRSRAPSVDPKKLKEFLSTQTELTALAARLRQFEDLRRREEMTTPHIAFEAMTAILGARIAGHSDEEVRRTWPVEWGDASLEVPAALLEALAAAWVEYRDGVSSREMAAVFGLGRRYRGQHNPISRQRTRDRDRRLSNAVELEYIASAAEGAGKSLEICIEEVADRLGSSVDTVRKAHRAYAGEVRQACIEAGFLTGVKR